MLADLVQQALKCWHGVHAYEDGFALLFPYAQWSGPAGSNAVSPRQRKKYESSASRGAIDVCPLGTHIGTRLSTERKQ
jgi:hypothetical protein